MSIRCSGWSFERGRMNLRLKSNLQQGREFCRMQLRAQNPTCGMSWWWVMLWKGLQAVGAQTLPEQCWNTFSKQSEKVPFLACVLGIEQELGLGRITGWPGEIPKEEIPEEEIPEEEIPKEEILKRKF